MKNFLRLPVARHRKLSGAAQQLPRRVPRIWFPAAAAVLVLSLSGCSASASNYPTVDLSEAELTQALSDAGLICTLNEEVMAEVPDVTLWNCTSSDLAYPEFGVDFFAEEQTLEDFCSDMTMINWPGNFDLLHLGASNFAVYSRSGDAGDLPSTDVLKINEVIEPVLSRVGKAVGVYPSSTWDLCDMWVGAPSGMKREE